MPTARDNNCMEKNSKAFATRLRDLREEAGLSMMELAREIGVSDAAVCKWENGLAEPKLSYIIRLAEYFDCSTDYLIGKDGDFPIAKPMRAGVRITDAAGNTVKPKNAHIAAVRTDDEQLLVELGDLSPDVKAALREAVKALGGKSANGAHKPDKNKPKA